MAFVQVKECLSDPKQLVKLVVLVVCICVTIYQLTGCFQKLLNPPITTHYDFHLNESIKYPSLTICRKPAFKTNLFQTYGVTYSPSASTNFLRSINAFKNFKFDEYNVSDFLEGTTYNFAETVVYYGIAGQGGQNSALKMESSYFSRKGACHTITPTSNINVFSIAGGYYLYLFNNNTDAQIDYYGRSTVGFDVFVHNDNEVLLPEFTLTDEENDSPMDYFYVEKNDDLFITLTLHQYSKVSTPQEPCNSDIGYSTSKCMEKCIHNQIAQRVGCTLPFLRQLDYLYEECSDEQSVKAVISGFNRVNYTRMSKKCNCPSACHLSMYITNVRVRKESDSDLITGANLNIYFSSNLITTMVQVVGYDWNTFLADLGASLGFLLGLSVIGIISVIEEQILAFVKRRDKKKQKEALAKIANSEITWKSDESGGEGKSLKSIMEFLSECDNYEKENRSKEDNDKY